MSKEFKQYVSGGTVRWLILPCMMSCLLIVLIIRMITGNDVGYAGFFVFGGILLASLIPIWNHKKFFEELAKETELCQRIEEDFSKSVPMMKNRIRFGETWIYKKNSTKLLKYNEIIQVYQYIHKTNFVENERALMYVDLKGKQRKLCNLLLHDKSRDDMMKMISIIHTKNPSVKIGYR